MTDREKIFDIEPTSTVDEVMEEHRKSPKFDLYHIGVKGGCEAFYDNQGPRVIRDIFKLEMDYIDSNKSELGIHCAELTSKHGDLHIISEKKPVLDSLVVKGKDGEDLEVRLTVTEVK